MNRIYFDFNASTPLAPEVWRAMLPILQSEFGNPSSHHWAGDRLRAALNRARQQAATHLRCEADEIVFTSGGTEGNNAALAGVYFAQTKTKRPEIIISDIEHPSIAQTCEFLARLGAVIKCLPVDGAGLVNPEDARRLITADTVLISVMHANNEVGTLQPIRELAAISRENNILIHTDAAQSIGKVPLSVADLGVDLLTVAGHKMYAPQGVGALFIRRSVRLEPFLHGAGHEQGRRAGTENVASTVGLGAAFELADLWIQDSTVRALRDRFWQRLKERFGERVILNGHPDLRLPNTLHVSFLGHSGYEILARIPELAASTGSACHAGAQHYSSVLRAMGLSPEAGAGAIRFSLGRTSTLAEVEAVVDRLAKALT